MQSIILIGPKDWDWSSMKEYSVPGEKAKYEMGSDRFVVEFDNDYVAFNHDPSIRNDYDDDELMRVPFTDRTFVLVEYKSRAALQRILAAGVIPDEVWLDDDHHPPIRAKDFKEAVAANPSWDWRQS